MADGQYGDSEGMARRLHGTTDAQVWAQEFWTIFGDRLTDLDEGTMIGWFANAIETGRTAGVRSVDEAFREVHERWKRVTEGTGP